MYGYTAEKPLSIKDSFTCDVKAGQHKTAAKFFVVKDRSVPLLSGYTATELGVLKIHAGLDIATDGEDLKRQHPAVFSDGIGKLNMKQIILHNDHTVPPVAQPIRHAPFNIRDKLEEKICELRDLDLIEPVDGLTPWVSPIFTAPQANGDIRLCFDM